MLKSALRLFELLVLLMLLPGNVSFAQQGSEASGPNNVNADSPKPPDTELLSPTLTDAATGAQARDMEPTKRLSIRQYITGERGDIGFFAVGNFNPTTYITIQSTPPTVISSNKSSVGGGFEYRRWLGNHNALGLLFVQNPSNGKLLWGTDILNWPDMRWDLSILATQKVRMGKFTPFLCEGPGVIVTNGNGSLEGTMAGWSADFAFVAGLGVEYELSPRLSGRAGMTFLDSRPGCYGDPTCKPTWGVAQDARVGIVYKWGGER
jgi:hypothetical protein